jgi:plasmid stabilization system protein ParE
MTKAELLARHGVVNGSPPATVVVMDGEAATGGGSAPPPETRLAAQIAPDMADYELKDTPVDPLTALQNAVNNLDVARYEARQCRQAVSASRENFNLALTAWNATMPIQTQEALRAEWMAANQEQRRLRAEAQQLQRPATVGETAKAMSGGNMRRSPAAYRRGAYTRAEAKAANNLRAAAARMNGGNAPRAKLPSER